MKLTIEDKRKIAASLAKKHDCDTYVCGHFHVDEKLVMKHAGVTIIVLPRGFTDLEIA